MAREDSGVLFYTTGYATIPAHFPNGKVCCNFCPACNKNDHDAWKCMWIGGQAMSPIDGKSGILVNCPIEFNDETIRDANEELRR